MRTFTRSLVALGLAAAFVLTAVPASASSEDDAADAVEEYVNAAFAGKWDETYDLLPTAQSDLFTETDWAACQEESNGRLVGAELESLKVVKSKKKKSFDIPGTDETAPALALKLRFSATLNGQTQPERDTVNVVREGKSWHPAVSADQIEACISSP